MRDSLYDCGAGLAVFRLAALEVTHTKHLLRAETAVTNVSRSV